MIKPRRIPNDKKHRKRMGKEIRVLLIRKKRIKTRRRKRRKSSH
jgi:hypothetical protein